MRCLQFKLIQILVFRTDSEIGIVEELNGDTEEQDLQPWEADEDELVGLDTMPTLDDKGGRRSGKYTTTSYPPDEMFALNHDKNVGKSTFDANLPQYSKWD